MHHTETFKNTSALATPAANRSASPGLSRRPAARSTAAIRETAPPNTPHGTARKTADTSRKSSAPRASSCIHASRTGSTT